MLPSASDLEYFLCVAKLQNISKAASELGVSQPTLTQSMKKLEAAVGVTLFLRSAKGALLTPAGHRVLSRATELMDVWQSLRHVALQEEHELSGHFRIGAHPAVACYLWPPFFRHVKATAPRVELSLVHDLSRKIAEGVLQFKIDLGFVINPPLHNDLVIKPLGFDTVAIFSSSNRYTDILFGDPVLIQTQDILRKIKSSQFSYSQFVECSSLEVIQSLVTSGAGYGILPKRVACSEGASTLEIVDPNLPVFRDRICLVYRKEVMASPSGKVLVQAAARMKI
jgi:DNA-binding transcriptional LysR family regulator